MFRNHKIMPLVFMVISVLYFIYVVSLGSSTMIGDEIGGDPGGMLLPLVLSIFMFLGSAVVFFTDLKPNGRATASLGSSERRKFALTVGVAIAYVVLMRPLGFLLSTVLLMFTLTFFYLRGTVERKELGYWAAGSVVSVVILLAIYSIGRQLTRYLLVSSRTGKLPQWMGNSTFTVALVLIIVLAFYLLLFRTARKRFRGEGALQIQKHLYDACLLSVLSTELIYLVFRQMFLVELVRGLITW